MYRRILSLLVLLLGAALLAGGFWLAFLGGSWFYIPLGAALVVSSALLLWRRSVGLSLYGITLIVTLGWALWEVGFDWWALAPRGGLLIVLGVLLLLPWMVRSLHAHAATPGRYGPNAAVLAVAILLSVLVGVYAMFQSPHDIEGAFSEERMAARDATRSDVAPGEWVAYGRTVAGLRYSPLDEITPQNVADLEVAWTYHTGEVRRPDDPVETTYEVTPLVIDDMMYICTPFSTVIALDPVTGAERWSFDPHLIQPPTVTTQHMTCRGVSYYDGSAVPAPAATGEEGPAASADPPAATGTSEAAGQQAATGADPNEDRPSGAEKPATSAGTASKGNAELVQQSVAAVTTDAAGAPQNVVADQAEPGEPNPQVDREEVKAVAPVDPSCMQRLFVSTSDGRLISISAETGRICPGFGGGDGTVNLWANMPNVTPGSVYSTSPALVTDRLVIVGGTVNDNVATTSPSGVIRAYDVNTGALVWNFDSKNPDSLEPIPNDQTYSQNAPNSWSVSSYDPELGLIYLPMGNQSPDQYGGNRSEAVERFSSSILALDADTGEVAWVFQTVHHDIWDYDVPAQPSLVDLTIDEERVPALVAPTKQGDVFVLNRETGEPVLPVSEVPVPQGAVEGDFTAPSQPVSAISFSPPPLTGKHMWGVTLLDQLYCRIRLEQLRYEGLFTPPSTQGTVTYPGSFGVFNWGAVAVDPNRQVMFGMPVYLAFTSKLFPRDDLLERVVTKDGEPVINENFGAPYAVTLLPFLSPLDLPCQQPPWGYVAGVDLTTGEIVYKHVNGTVRDLSPIPLPFEMGVPGIGGPIITGSGVAFLSGTLDYYVRAYDLQTGREIWQERLPAGGQATPSTYLGADGRQYLVVVAGGHGSTGTKAGDAIIAYALPPD